MISHFWRPSTDYTRPASPSFNILKYPSTDQQQKHSKNFFYQVFLFSRLSSFYCPRARSPSFERIRYRTITSEVCSLIAKWEKKCSPINSLTRAHLNITIFPELLALRCLTKTTCLRKQVETYAVMENRF